MVGLVAGVLVLVAALLAGRAFLGASPRQLAYGLRTGGAIGLMAVAGMLAIAGRWAIAAPLAGFALALFGRSPFSRRPRSTGQTSTVRTHFVEMSLDHDTGDMSGTVLAGRFARASLDMLQRDDLLALLGEAAADPESVALLEAYLDRRLPGWREDFQADPATGAAQAGPMTEQEAYQILGLQPGAGEDDIRRAHRALMKKLHPDQGGSTYLATRVNQAKDVLLRVHRRS